MKRAPLFLLAVSGCVLLSQCATNSGGHGDYEAAGPFDADGTYREDWADDPTKWSRPGDKRQAPPVLADQPPVDAKPIVSTTATTTATTTPKPTPRPTPKPKPKPKTVTHTVKKGESLWGIASRYKISVSALQKANTIKGSIIRPGQVLRIPR